MKPIKYFLAGAAVAVALAGSPVLAGTVLQDAVTDARGNLVYNTFGNCVRTKWAAEQDQCAGMQAAEPVRSSYLVFFDFDKHTLTPDAEMVLNNLYNQAQEGGVPAFHVTGHADRSGPDAYNMKLSQRRAEAVKSALERLGASTITVEWKGERQPLVPTKDGIREPQNRRAGINVKVGAQK